MALASFEKYIYGPWEGEVRSIVFALYMAQGHTHIWAGS